MTFLFHKKRHAFSVGKPLIIALLWATVVASECGPHTETHFKTVRRYTSPSHVGSIVLLESECSRCSGFVAAKGLVVTAAHCTNFVGEKLEVFYENGQKRNFRVIVRKPNFRAFTNEDVAVVAGDTLNYVALPLAPKPFQPGMCVAFGYGGPGIPPGHPVQQGTLCRNAGDKDKDGMLVLWGSIDHGDSGGPVGNAQAQVIGINESIAGWDLPLFWTVPSTAIAEALRKAKAAH